MNLVVVGGGRTGLALARWLERNGHRVDLVDEGDPLDRQTLVAAGVERADGLAAVAPSDEVNLAVATAARRLFFVPRVVARLHDPRRAAAYHRAGVLTFSPLPWGVRRLSDLLVRPAHEPVASLGGGEVDLLEVPVPARLVGRAFHSLAVPGEIRPISLARHGRAILPEPEEPLEEGDRVQAAVSGAGARRLLAMMEV